MISTEDEYEVTNDDFTNIIYKYEKNKSKSSDLIVKAGVGYKNAIFKLSKRIDKDVLVREPNFICSLSKVSWRLERRKRMDVSEPSLTLKCFSTNRA